MCISRLSEDNNYESSNLGPPCIDDISAYIVGLTKVPLVLSVSVLFLGCVLFEDGNIK